MRIVLAMASFESLNTQDKGERLTAATGQLSSTWYCWQGGWQIIQHPLDLPTALEAGEESHRRDLSSEFIAVGDADTFWHPQFFGTVTFESQRSTEDKFISLQ